MKGEFHIHTTYSDGMLSVREILEVLKGNIDWFAITDHDVIDGSVEAFHLAKEYGLKSLVGIEISTYLKDEPIHILGYFKDDSKLYIIKDFLDEITRQRLERLYKIKDLLLKHFNIDLDVTNMLSRKSVTRGTIAKEILRQGFPYTKEEIFKKLIGNDCPCYIPVSRITPREASFLIHEAGGLAVLAHPVLLKKNDFKEVCKMGLDGIEAYYPVNTKEDTEKFKQFALENDLIVTCGNDFHYEGCLNHGNLLELSLEGKELEEFINKVYER